MGAEKPLLEERCPKGGVVASYRTMTSTPIFLPLLEEKCPQDGVVVL